VSLKFLAQVAEMQQLAEHLRQEFSKARENSDRLPLVTLARRTPSTAAASSSSTVVPQDILTSLSIDLVGACFFDFPLLSRSLVRADASSGMRQRPICTQKIRCATTPATNRATVTETSEALNTAEISHAANRVMT